MASRGVLTGSLRFIGLADIFQILGGNSSTGVLHITSPHAPNPGLIYFLNGDPINASCDSLKGLKSIYTLFGWTEGEYVFYEEKSNVEHLIKHNRMEIVLDAMRMIDDGVIKRVGPLSFDEAFVGRSDGRGGKAGLPVIKGSLVDYSYIIREEIYKDGATIVSEENHGKWMWVIFEGTVRISRETTNGPLVIARLGEGCFIGTVKALLFGDYARNATVTAEGDVRLCLLDTERLYMEYESLSPHFRILLLSLDNRLRRITDRAVALSMKGDEGMGLTKDKKEIIKAGSSQKDLFVITEGEAYIIDQTNMRNLDLLMLKKQDVFGYIPFMDIGHEPRSASVVASHDLKIEKLDTQSYQEEYKKLSGIFRNFVYHIGTSTSLTTSLVRHIHERN